MEYLFRKSIVHQASARLVYSLSTASYHRIYFGVETKWMSQSIITMYQEYCVHRFRLSNTTGDL